MTGFHNTCGLSCWTPVVESDLKPDPMALDFTLTPKERSQAATFACQIEARRRRINEADKAREDAQEAAQAYKIGVRW